jgi:uncharacterized membrane protein
MFVAQTALWVAWNVFLAAIPVATGLAMAALIERFTLRSRRVPLAAWTPVALVWFVFLPNTCYLLTEWRHFIANGNFVELATAAETRQSYLLPIARWSLFYVFYSGIGIVTFGLSIRPVERVLRRLNAPMNLLAAPFFFVTSLGVYMGLIVRLNSWDLGARPGHVLEVALHGLTTPELLRTIVAFAICLWILYELVDIWLDGVQLRIERWRQTAARSREKA